MSFQNSKEAAPSRGTIWLLCAAFILFTATAHATNQNISWMLSGVDQIVHKERYQLIELILKYKNIVSILFVIYIILNLKLKFKIVLYLCLLPHIFFFLTSICVFFIDNLDMHQHIDRERFIVNTICIVILLLISEKYQERNEV